MTAANRVVFMYGLAAVASICIPLALSLAAGATTQLFPQASHEELVRAVRSDLSTIASAIGL